MHGKCFLCIKMNLVIMLREFIKVFKNNVKDLEFQVIISNNKEFYFIRIIGNN